MIILNALKGVQNEPELNRILGGIGVLVYTFSVPLFVLWGVNHGHPFDLTTFCTLYPAGFGVMMASVAGAIAVKDRNVAAARTTHVAADQIGNSTTTTS